MAAIIARITRENRERIMKRRHYVGANRSVYVLKQFPEQFDPEVHNKESYFARHFIVYFKWITWLIRISILMYPWCHPSCLAILGIAVIFLSIIIIHGFYFCTLKEIVKSLVWLGNSLYVNIYSETIKGLNIVFCQEMNLVM